MERKTDKLIKISVKSYNPNNNHKKKTADDDDDDVILCGVHKHIIANDKEHLSNHSIDKDDNYTKESGVNKLKIPKGNCQLNIISIDLTQDCEDEEENKKKDKTNENSIEVKKGQVNEKETNKDLQDEVIKEDEINFERKKKEKKKEKREVQKKVVEISAENKRKEQNFVGKVFKKDMEASEVIIKYEPKYNNLENHSIELEETSCRNGMQCENTDHEFEDEYLESESIVYSGTTKEFDGNIWENENGINESHKTSIYLTNESNEEDVHQEHVKNVDISLEALNHNFSQHELEMMFAEIVKQLNITYNIELLKRSNVEKQKNNINYSSNPSYEEKKEKCANAKTAVEFNEMCTNQFRDFMKNITEQIRSSSSMEENATSSEKEKNVENVSSRVLNGEENVPKIYGEQIINTFNFFINVNNPYEYDIKTLKKHCLVVFEFLWSEQKRWYLLHITTYTGPIINLYYHLYQILLGNKNVYMYFFIFKRFVKSCFMYFNLCNIEMTTLLENEVTDTFCDNSMDTLYDTSKNTLNELTESITIDNNNNNNNNKLHSNKNMKYDYFNQDGCATGMEKTNTDELQKSLYLNYYSALPEVSKYKCCQRKTENNFVNTKQNLEQPQKRKQYNVDNTKKIHVTTNDHSMKNDFYNPSTHLQENNEYPSLNFLDFLQMSSSDIKSKLQLFVDTHCSIVNNVLIQWKDFEMDKEKMCNFVEKFTSDKKTMEKSSNLYKENVIQFMQKFIDVFVKKENEKREENTIVMPINKNSSYEPNIVEETHSKENTFRTPNISFGNAQNESTITASQNFNHAFNETNLNENINKMKNNTSDKNVFTFLHRDSIKNRKDNADNITCRINGKEDLVRNNIEKEENDTKQNNNFKAYKKIDNLFFEQLNILVTELNELYQLFEFCKMTDGYMHTHNFIQEMPNNVDAEAGTERTKEKGEVKEELKREEEIRLKTEEETEGKAKEKINEIRFDKDLKKIVKTENKKERKISMNEENTKEKKQTNENESYEFNELKEANKKSNEEENSTDKGYPLKIVKHICPTCLGAQRSYCERGKKKSYNNIEKEQSNKTEQSNGEKKSNEKNVNDAATQMPVCMDASDFYCLCSSIFLCDRWHVLQQANKNKVYWDTRYEIDIKNENDNANENIPETESVIEIEKIYPIDNFMNTEENNNNNNNNNIDNLYNILTQNTESLSNKSNKTGNKVGNIKSNLVGNNTNNTKNVCGNSISGNHSDYYISTLKSAESSETLNENNGELKEMKSKEVKLSLQEVTQKNEHGDSIKKDQPEKKVISQRPSKRRSSTEVKSSRIKRNDRFTDIDKAQYKNMFGPTGVAGVYFEKSRSSWTAQYKVGGGKRKAKRFLVTKSMSFEEIERVKQECIAYRKQMEIEYEKENCTSERRNLNNSSSVKSLLNSSNSNILTNANSTTSLNNTTNSVDITNSPKKKRRASNR